MLSPVPSGTLCNGPGEKPGMAVGADSSHEKQLRLCHAYQDYSQALGLESFFAAIL